MMLEMKKGDIFATLDAKEIPGHPSLVTRYTTVINGRIESISWYCPEDSPEGRPSNTVYLLRKETDRDRGTYNMWYIAAIVDDVFSVDRTTYWVANIYGKTFIHPAETEKEAELLMIQAARQEFGVEVSNLTGFHFLRPARIEEYPAQILVNVYRHALMQLQELLGLATMYGENAAEGDVDLVTVSNGFAELRRRIANLMGEMVGLRI